MYFIHVLPSSEFIVILLLFFSTVQAVMQAAINKHERKLVLKYLFIFKDKVVDSYFWKI